MPNDFQLWCEDCQKSYEGDCVEHGPFTKVADTDVSTRARRSLPAILELKHDVFIGVYAKETLTKRIQFGPLQSPVIIDDISASIKQAVEKEIQLKYGIVYRLYSESSDMIVFDTRKEEKSNWMIFVRPAEKKSEQNLVAFQYLGQIYFATIKEISRGCELRVWFSKDYADKMGLKVLFEEKIFWQFRTRQRFPCHNCQVVFSSAASLKNHQCTNAKDNSNRGVRKSKKIHKQISAEIDISEVTEHPAITVEFERPEIESQAIEAQGPSTSPSTPKEKISGYKCPLCDKVFGSPGKLKQHSYSHSGERPFACNICNKAFSSKFKLGRHQLIHSMERKYQCPRCERSFHRKDHLKNHLQIHEPHKQFKCERPNCGKEYSTYMSYRKHCASHAVDEGDLQCKICSEFFENKVELVSHLKVHVGTRSVKSPGEKKFQCTQCDRKFFTRKDVKRHSVVHTGKRDFVCSLCPQKFGRKDHLVRHIKKSHYKVEPYTSLESPTLLSMPGSSLSPEQLKSSPSSEDHSLASVLLEPIPGPSGLQSLSASCLTTEETEVSYGIFDVKMEPDLSPSMEGLDTSGEDIQKIMSMYLSSPVLEQTPSRLMEGNASELFPSLLSEEPQLSHSPLLESQSLLSAEHLSARESEPLADPQSIVVATTTATTTSAASTSTASVYTTLPGFDQAFS